jgi:DNA modification methylase
MIILCDARRSIPLRDASVHCVVTSPPYFGLRDYGDPRQVGLEPTPEAYVARQVAIFREVRRVLRDDGTLWLNIGDSYANTRGRTCLGETSQRQGRANVDAQHKVKGYPGGDDVKIKDLIGIPWMLAFALRADGWYLRSDIIWEKPNPMPESVTDRPSKSHEYVFLLSKSKTYYYDEEAIREPGTRYAWTAPQYKNGDITRHHGNKDGGGGSPEDPEAGRNSRSVWTISTRPFKGAHFATMPVDLAERCILAGTSEKGVCPACGAPWERVIEADRVATRPGVASKVYEAAPLDPGSPYNGHAGDICGNRDPQRHVTTKRTTGWVPTCPCEAGDPVPAVVFDPYGGAMTTPVAARRLGRVGVASELRDEYARMGQGRLRGSIYAVSGVRPKAKGSTPLLDLLDAPEGGVTT